MADKEKYESKISEIEKEISTTKKNKATEKHIGILRAKISKAKKEMSKIKKTGGKGFFVRKNGDATVSLVGFPSTGKSSLINAITNITSKTAEYSFTTTSIIQGTLIFKDAHIQILDLPGILEYAHLGHGGGSSVISQIRSSDLIIFVIDVNNKKHLEILMEELKSSNIYINKNPPYIKHTNMNNSPFKIIINKSGIDSSFVRDIFNGLGIFNGDVIIKNKIEEDELIAIILNKARYINAIVALNKIDISRNYQKLVHELVDRFNIEVIPVSATNLNNTEELKSVIYKRCDIIRVFVKPKEEKHGSPVTLKSDSTVKHLAKKIHTKLTDTLKSAYITGPSTKFPNQRVSSKHILKDGDIITFVRDRW